MPHIFIVILLLSIVLTYLLTSQVSFTALIGNYLTGGGIGLLTLSILFLLVFQSFTPDVFPLSDALVFNQPIGIILAIIGFLVFFFGKIRLGGNWGMPGQHNLKSQPRLVTAGIYKYTRNPIYLGLIAFFVGCEILLNSWLCLMAVPICLVIHQKILREERLLKKYFSAGYSRYSSTTPRYF